MFEVRVAAELAAATARRWGPERTVAGLPSEYDFWTDLLAAATVAFFDFDSREGDVVPEG